MPIKTASAIDQTEPVQRRPRPISTADDSTLVLSACGWRHRISACEAATQH